MTRKQYNKKILKLLAILVRENRDLRFCQLLTGYGVLGAYRHDPFNDESKWTYNTLKTRLKDLGLITDRKVYRSPRIDPTRSSGAV